MTDPAILGGRQLAPIVTPGRARVVLAVAALAIVGCGEDDDTEANGSTPALEADLVVE